MPRTLTALFATALHEARLTDSEPVGIQRAAALLVTAAGARRIEWRVDRDDLVVNDYLIRTDSPGADLVIDALRQHLTRRLALPAGLSATQWVDLAGLYASAPGIYPTAGHMRAALNGIVPGASFEHSADRVAEIGERSEPSSGLSGLADAIRPGDPALVSREADRSELSGRIDPVLDAARQAVARTDWVKASELLLELDAIATGSDDATRSIVARERQRLLSVSDIELLAAEVPTRGASSVEMQALTTLGRDGAEALFELLADRPSRDRQRLYLDVLARMRDVDDILVTALGSKHDAVAGGAATVIGRRRLERAVPVLGALLKHHDEEVRTAAWRALEDIGTAEARELLR